MSGAFEQRAIDTYTDLCGQTGLRTFKTLIPEIQEAYPMGPNGQHMEVALRAIHALADAASYESAGTIDKFLETNCPRLPEGFVFTPQSALETLDRWVENGTCEGIGVRGISVEALARILRQGGIMPRYIGRDWKVEFTPYPQTITSEMQQRGLSIKGARWPKELTDAAAQQDNRTFAKTNAVIAYLGEPLGLSYEFDGNGRQKELDEPVTAYDLTFRHLDECRVKTYDPDERTAQMAMDRGLSGTQLRHLLKRGLNREGVQIAIHASVLDDLKVQLGDTGAGTAVIMPGNTALPLKYIIGIEFLGKPGEAYQSPEHEEIVKALQKATKP